MEKFRYNRSHKVRDQILETTAIRREQFRNVNYFRDSPIEIKLRFLAADPTYYYGSCKTSNEQFIAVSAQEAAQQLITELDCKRKTAIEELPSIEGGATVAERFVHFFEKRDFKTLDLDRTNHPGGNWDAADSMQSELDDLLAVLELHLADEDNPQFEIDIFDLAPENCTMYFHAISPEALKAGLICMTRNTHKATIYDKLTKDTIFIKKRSEYIYDLSLLEPHVAELIRSKIEAHFSKNSYMVESDFFRLINDTVVERPEAIELIHSNLFAYRETWQDEVSEPELPQVLRRKAFDGQFVYSELVENWNQERQRERGLTGVSLPN